MAKQTTRKKKDQGVGSKFWSEFLFAREFEYETPLTPDEIADALNKIEAHEHKAWFLSTSGLNHQFEYESNGDKAGHFTIELTSKHREKWWATKSAMQYAEGTISANQDTGMTSIKGSTRFSKQYYLLFLFMFASNFIAQSFNNQSFFQIVWIIIIVLFWYSMYRERNKMADKIDNIIMNAKSDSSVANLTDDEDDSTLTVEEQLKRGYLSS